MDPIKVISGEIDWAVLLGDSLAVLRSLPSNSIDSSTSDPPSGIRFMGYDWDSFPDRENFIAFIRAIMTETLRVLKPGGHVFVWALPRTSHWTATAIEDAGLKIRDVFTHIFSSGVPKAMDVSKAIDEEAGAEREVIGPKLDLSTGRPMSTSQARGGHTGSSSDGWDRPWRSDEQRVQANTMRTAPATDEAKTWDGWATAMKPASEHWILAQKPIVEKTIAQNLIKHRTGALNINVSRIDSGFAVGYWPANLLISHAEDCVEIGEPSTWKCSSECPVPALDATGQVSHCLTTFRHVKKPAQTEKDFGCQELYWKKDGSRPAGVRQVTRQEWDRLLPDEREQGNIHNTVKGIELMSWLCKLITPPGGVILDMFAGSGTTGVAARSNGFRFIGIEREEEYVAISRARVLTGHHWNQEKTRPTSKVKRSGDEDNHRQLGLLLAPTDSKIDS